MCIPQFFELGDASWADAINVKMKNVSDSVDQNIQLKKLVERAKQVLPLEKMLEQLDDWELCVEDKLCPFHDDHSPSFSMFTIDEHQFWKCHAGCGAGDQISYLQHKFGLSRGEGLHLFLEMAGVSDQDGGRFHE